MSFDVDEGEIFAFLGPNGAGKTTPIKMLTTLLTPTGGRSKSTGMNPERISTKCGSVLASFSRTPAWTGFDRLENMEIHGALYHVPSKMRASERGTAQAVQAMGPQDSLVKNSRAA